MIDKRKIIDCLVENIEIAFDDAKSKNADPYWKLISTFPYSMSVFDSQEYYEFKAVFYLLISWSNAVNNDLSFLQNTPRISTKDAEGLITSARDLLIHDIPITNDSILEFGKGMIEIEELRKIFIRVINNSLKEAEDWGFESSTDRRWPGYDCGIGPAEELKASIPNYLSVIERKENEDLRALANLLDSWAHSFNHGLHKLEFGERILLSDAKELILLAKRELESSKSITDKRILEFANY